MKKMLLALAAVLALAGSSLAFAASTDSEDFAKELKIAEKMFDVYDGAPIPPYGNISGSISPNFKEKFTKGLYQVLPTRLTEKFGTMVEYKFTSYERFDNYDQLTFIGSFTKDTATNMIVMVFGFDKRCKLTNFSLAPYKAPGSGEETAAAAVAEVK